MQFKKSKKRKAYVGNQKVRNATAVEYDGIKFRSKLERYMYQQLKEAKLDFEYEKEKFVLIEPFEYNGEKVRACTYLPDFIVTIKGKKYVVEAKGMKTDVWNLKYKMIKKYLVEKGLNYPMFLPRNQEQCRKVIDELRLL
jgi:hypothetical protein